MLIDGEFYPRCFIHNVGTQSNWRYMLNLEGLAHQTYSKDESMKYETLADRVLCVLAGNFVDPFAVP